jgi:hypothetical protein
VKKVSKFHYSILICALGVFLSWGITDCFAAPTFYSTSSYTNWLVSHNTQAGVDDGTLDNNTSYFILTGTNAFSTASAITNEPTRNNLWIANNNEGSNGGVGNWTFFVFRQTFDLNGYDPATTVLSFKWAADDSGEIFAARGSWIPKFSLNGGAFIYYPGSSPSSRIPTYSLSDLVTLSSGFVSGSNTIDFYVEGNGQTDGFALTNVSLTARESSAVPEPATMLLLGLGLTGVARLRKKFARA